ncbi:uncharacterized protein LOC103515031 [Diaphorina citri]|uniref:Uncharacterized protein LOC103515031 n=1 Tax=Diaphorina citri TaxID=121845 RepID=A0A3Q0JAA5_DIACI|nr:uncharacterized protein LOC103515031 [Diaphorina citri]
MACFVCKPCPCNHVNFHEMCDTAHETNDDISDIFSLIDQYHDLCKQVIEEEQWGCVDSSRISVDRGDIDLLADQEKQTIDIVEASNTTDHKSPADNITDESPDKTENPESLGQEEPPVTQIKFEDIGREERTEKRVQFVNNSRDENKLENRVQYNDCEQHIERTLHRLRTKRAKLKRKFQREVRRQKNLKTKWDIVKEKSVRYEERMEYHYGTLSQKNEECGLLCQRICQELEQLKQKQGQYRKSPRALDLDLKKLHRKKKVLKLNEYHVLMVRNLKLKIETTEKNIQRLEKEIEKQTLLILERKRHLNPAYNYMLLLNSSNLPVQELNKNTI